MHEKLLKIYSNENSGLEIANKLLFDVSNLLKDLPRILTIKWFRIRMFRRLAIG